jgi:hypothetical protein
LIIHQKLVILKAGRETAVMAKVIIALPVSKMGIALAPLRKIKYSNMIL